MINQKGNVFTLKREVKLSPRQLSKIKHLDVESKALYVKSVMGLGPAMFSFTDKKLMRYNDSNGIDKLSQKRTNSVVAEQRRTLDSSAGMNHKPLVDTAKNRWVGVEIECFIEELGDCESDSCFECDDTGEVTCHTCEGHGEVTLYDNADNCYEVECRECEGEGRVECPECDGSGGRSSGGYELLRDKIREAGIGRVSVREDGSVDSSEGGVEICMLFDASNGFKKLEKLCKVLNDMGATVTHKCGLHIHLNQHGMDSEGAMKLGKSMEKFLPVISRFMPESRRENDFCRLQACDRERYSAINLCSFKKFGTIEYRLHTGTTNFEKIRNWIQLLIHLEDYSKNNRLTKPFKKMESMFKRTKLSKHLVEFYRERYKKFNDDVEEDSKPVYKVSNVDVEAGIITVNSNGHIEIINRELEHIIETIEQVA